MSRELNGIGIGPLSPPTTGPGVKNKHLKSGLKSKGIHLDWVNTLENRNKSFFEVVYKLNKYDYFLLSVSSNGRMFLSPPIAIRVATSPARSILLPAGGEFANELRRLPIGLQQFYLRVFGTFDAILPQTQQQVSELTPIFHDHDVLVRQLPNLRPLPDLPSLSDEDHNLNDGLKLVYVGRIKESKGIEIMIESVRDLNRRHPKTQLDIFGSFLKHDQYESKFKKRVKDSENISFNGPLPNGEVIFKMSEYDVLLFPTYYEGEGFPGVIVEAFMASVPVIATNWKYNNEIITPYVNGLLCEPKSVQSLVEQINWLYNHPSKLTEMKRNAREEATQYSVETVTNRLLTILETADWEL